MSGLIFHTARPRPITGVVGLSLALLPAIGCGPQEEWKDTRSPEMLEPSGRALSVNTIVAERTASYQQRRSYSGILRARRTSEASFGRAGKVVRVLVDLGDEVSSGDLIAEQETSQLSLRKDDLERSRARAGTALGKMIADSQLKSMESVRIEVGDLKKEFQEIREEIDSQENPNESTDARLSRAEQRLDILDAVSGDPQVTAQRAVIADLDAKIAALDVELTQSRLVAPIDGTIAQRYISEGTIVSPGVAIVRIVETGAIEAWISIPSDAAQHAAEGDKYRIQVGARELDATVSAKLPELDRTTRTRTVVFAFENAGSALAGDVARVELVSEVESSGFWLPITALTRASGGLWSVYAVDRAEDDSAIVSRRLLEVVHTEGDRVRVRGTLDDGERVIVDGTHRVVPGQRVDAIEAEAMP